MMKTSSRDCMRKLWNQIYIRNIWLLRTILTNMIVNCGENCIRLCFQQRSLGQCARRPEPLLERRQGDCGYFVLKTIKRFEEKNGANQELLPEFKDEEDQEFARRLFRRAILNCDYYRHLISENTRNWDLDRVAFMDVVIMQCALAEILSFPNIPVSVSLNEYVDIAKVYSTVKSGSFVNGTLDGIVNQLKKEGKLTKN